MLYDVILTCPYQLNVYFDYPTYTTTQALYIWFVQYNYIFRLSGSAIIS